MQLESIDIRYCSFDGFSVDHINGLTHIKQLRFLSVVQAVTGSYGIQLDNGPIYETGEGGFFLAPSLVTQRIVHHTNPASDRFTARYLFLDIIINQKYHFDDLFDFPVVTDTTTSYLLNQAFDRYVTAGTDALKMQALFGILEVLLSVASERKRCRNFRIYPILDYIRQHYTEHLCISDMASFLQMSESGFYNIFKKEIGTSPIQYLNEYRLSAARDLLLHTNDSIREISEAVGISDQFYFSRLFKRKYLISPQQYRKENFY